MGGIFEHLHRAKMYLFLFITYFFFLVRYSLFLLRIDSDIFCSLPLKTSYTVSHPIRPNIFVREPFVFLDQFLTDEEGMLSVLSKVFSKIFLLALFPIFPKPFRLLPSKLAITDSLLC